MPDMTLPTPAAAGSGWVEALRRAWESLTISVTRLVVPMKASTAAMTAAASSASILASALNTAAAAARAAQAAIGAGGRPAAQLAGGLVAATAPARQLAAGIEAAAGSARKMAAPARDAAATTAAAGEAARLAGDKLGGLSQRSLLVGAAYVYATARLRGFISAALAGTTTGERLSYSTQQLQRSIAAAFVPAIEAVTTKIQALTRWFQNLSGEQQALLARFTGLAAGVLAAAAVVPKLAAALSTLGVTSPVVAVVAGLAGILARSEEGRAALLKFGEAAMDVFAGVVKIITATVLPVLGAIADTITKLVMPVIEGLTELLEDPAAKFVIVGAVVAAVSYSIITSFGGIRGAVVALGVAMKGAFTGALGPIGLVVGAVAAVAAAIGLAGSKTREFAKEAASLAEQVHKGQSTEAEARENIRIKAAIEAENEAEKARKAIPLLIPEARAKVEARIEEMRGRRQEELERAGGEAFDRILKRLGGRPRTELETAKKEVTTPAELIRKIEQAALQKDTDAKRTADGVEGIWDTLKNFWKFLMGKGDDKREDPPKAP